MFDFPPFDSLTVPVLNDFLERNSPFFRFTYTFRCQRFGDLVRFFIVHHRIEELVVLLDFIDPRLTTKDPLLITADTVNDAIKQHKLDAVLFLIDRYPSRLGPRERAYECVFTCRYTLLEFAYFRLLKNPEPNGKTYRQFFLQLMKRGSDIFGYDSYCDLKAKIRGNRNLPVKYLITVERDLESTRLLLTLASVYSIKRIGRKSNIVKEKLPLDIITRLVDFVRDR